MIKSIIIICIGAILTLISFIGISNPKKVFEFILSLNPTLRYLIAIFVRLLFGILLIYSASISNYSVYIYILGSIFILSGIIVIYLRPKKITVLLNWFNEMPNILNRIWMLIGILLGIFLILAAIF